MNTFFADQLVAGSPAAWAPQIGDPSISLTPGAASLTVTGFAPTISRSANQAVSPAAAGITLTGYAPVLSQTGNKALTPGAAALAISGFAPTLTQSGNLGLQPGAAVLAISGFAPSVAQTGSVNLIPGAASVTVSGFPPTVTRTGQSLRQSLYAALNPLADGGAWFQVNTAEPPVYPFIVFTRIVSPQNVSLQGASNLQNTRVQVDLFVRDDSQLETLEDAIDAAIASAFPQSVPISTQDLYEDAVKAYRSLREYSIWGAF